MTTKIRDIRKARGLTLQELAEKVGTTAQTIQRLETDNMTVSVDWLRRIAAAFNLPAAALLEGGGVQTVRYIGDVDADGMVTEYDANTAPAPLQIEVPGRDPLAVKLVQRLGPHDVGTILIANRFAEAEQADADGRDCLVQLTDGRLLFRRIVMDGAGGPSAFVPYDDRSGVERNLQFDWLAPVVMVVRYLPSDQP
jgi:transcriptional regulator with XRE-family HTH domain